MGQRFSADDPDLDMEVALIELNRFNDSLLGDIDDDTMVEVCTNCGSYHTENHDRCKRCQEI